MSYRELTMIEIKEVLRRWQAGQSVRKIGRDTSVGRKAAARYIHWATELGISQDRELREEDVHAVAQCVQSRPVPDVSDECPRLLPLLGLVDSEAWAIQRFVTHALPSGKRLLDRQREWRDKGKDRDASLISQAELDAQLESHKRFGGLADYWSCWAEWVKLGVRATKV